MGQSDKYRLSFTDEEETLVAKIDLRERHRSHDEGRKAYLDNQKPILELLASLDARGGVPEHRLRYWNNPEYNCGRVKGSRKSLFERNNCFGEEIYTHPHFIKHLRYILLGADLPDAVVAAFEREAGNPQWVSLSDAIPLGKFARKLVRQHGLDTADAPEEFFKLCLDMGLSLNVALSIMRSVKQAR